MPAGVGPYVCGAREGEAESRKEGKTRLARARGQQARSEKARARGLCVGHCCCVLESGGRADRSKEKGERIEAAESWSEPKKEKRRREWMTHQQPVRPPSSFKKSGNNRAEQPAGRTKLCLMQSRSLLCFSYYALLCVLSRDLASLVARSLGRP